MNTNKNIHADDGFDSKLVLGANFEGVFGFPVIKPPREIIVPDSLIPFSKTANKPDSEAFVMEYEYDGCFGELIKDPEACVARLKHFSGFIAPDNSVYLDSPPIVQLANIYRSRAVGYYIQSKGIYTIGNFRGGSEELYTDKFSKIPPVVDGLPRNSIIAIGPYGCTKNKASRAHFEASLYVALDYLKPKVVLVYGHGADKTLKKYKHMTQFVVYNDWTTVCHGGDKNGFWL